MSTAFIAFDGESKRIIRVAPTAELAVLWAEYICPECSLVVCDNTRRSYTLFSEDELRQLIFNVFGAKVTGGSYNDIIIYTCDRMQTLPVDNTTVEQLMRYMGRHRSDLPTPVRKLEKGEINPYNRPASKGVTARVWEICDVIDRDNPDINQDEFRVKVIESCQAEGINISTARTQYARWCRRGM